MHIFKNTNFDFLRWRWHAIALSWVVIIAGLFVLFTKGLPLGVEFAGGTSVIAQFALLAYDPRAFVPPATGAADVAAIRSDLRALPRPLFLPGDGYWLDAVTGAESFATNDLGYLKGEPWYAEILEASDKAVLEGRYAAVVLPSFLVDAYRDELAPHYRFDRWVWPRDRPVGIRHTDLVGWRTYPYAVFLRTP